MKRILNKDNFNPLNPKGQYTVFHVLLFVYKRHSNSMANQGASNNPPRPARDTRPSGSKFLTVSRCSLSQMPPKCFTAHQALTQILADDSEDIDASNYGNDSDFESEISVDSYHDSDSRSESDAAKPTTTKPDACQSSRGQGRHGNGRVAQSERGRRASTNWAPVLNHDNVDSDNSGNNKTKEHLKN